LAVGVAGQHQPPLRPPGMDPAEARGGERHEQPRMRRHRFGDALAAPQPSGKKLVGVGAVDSGAGGAARLAAGATGLQQHPIRLAVGVVGGAQLAGCPVGVLDPAGQADGVVAVAGLGHQLGPAVVAVAGALDDLLEDLGQQLAHAGRLGHVPPSGDPDSMHSQEGGSGQACQPPYRC
jgi:hypothetical protein